MTENFLQNLSFRHLYAEAVSVYYSKETWIQHTACTTGARRNHGTSRSDEANRCLGCKKPLCQQGCPIHTNIPEVIRLLKANQMDEAGRMLFENNPLTTVCALVCNHENQIGRAHV